jgi:hypothetical protein
MNFKEELLAHGWADREVDMSGFEHADADHNQFLSGDELNQEEAPGRTFFVLGERTNNLQKTKQSHGVVAEMSKHDYINAVRALWVESVQHSFEAADADKNYQLSVEEFMPLYKQLTADAKSRWFHMFSELSADPEQGLDFDAYYR